MGEAKRGEISSTGAFVLIFSVAAVLAYGYLLRINLPFFEVRLEFHEQIIAGTADSPYRYRVLLPFTEAALSRVLGPVVPSDGAAFVFAYAFLDLLSLTLALGLLYVWLRTWFSPNQALVGVLFVGGTMQVALQNHYYQPWSLLEPALLTAALLAIARNRLATLAVLVVLASLNRETAVFLPLALLATIDVGELRAAGGHGRRALLAGIALLLVWATIFWGLRWLRGAAPPAETIAGLWEQNTMSENLLFTVIQGTLFLGALWGAAALGYRRAPRIIRRVAWILPFYLATVVVWGVWSEVRLLMPLYPILVPMALSWFFEPSE